MRATTLAAMLTAALCSQAGCRSKSANLEPARSANALATLADAAKAESKGITVVAVAAEWPGEAYITDAVTPLRVTVSNDGNDSVHIRYSDFKLMGDSGVAYRALPPLAISGTVPTDLPPAAALDPGFEAQGFVIAAPYAHYYPGVSVYDGPFDHRPHYYDTYYGYWDVEARLPTPEMIASALPEGVVEPGGFVTGWLYFQKVDDDESRVSFQANLQESGGAPVAEMRIPFDAD